MPYKDKEKQNENQRQRLARNRANFFDGKSCVSCGSTDSLELDHIDPAQKVTHRIWGWGEARRSEELAKCQVLCRQCHMHKSAEEVSGHKAYTHGTSSSYFNRKCRCDACLKWFNEVRKPYNAAWMKNKRKSL